MKITYIGATKEIMQIDLTNHDGRVFFCTDIHGHFDLLHEQLRKVVFDSSKDILIIGGDTTDRGPDSQHVLDYLNEPWVFCIRGNHEQLFIEAFEEKWEGVSTNCLLSNGGTWIAFLDDQQLEVIYETFKSLPIAIELILDKEKIGIVHAQCPRDNWDEFVKMQKEEMVWNGYAMCQWSRTIYDYKKEVFVKGVDKLLVGHTPTDSGQVEVLGNIHYCDIGTFFRGKLDLIQLK